MGKSPCQEKKKDAQEVGLMNHRKMQVRIATANDVMVLVACPIQHVGSSFTTCHPFFKGPQ